jgi:hypothetical protein
MRNITSISGDTDYLPCPTVISTASRLFEPYTTAPDSFGCICGGKNIASPCQGGGQIDRVKANAGN